VRARDGDLERHPPADAGRRLGKLDLDARDHVRAASATAGAEQVVAEKRGEEIRERAEVEMAGLEASAAQTGVPVPVVQLARLGVGEHLVGLGGLAEARLGIRSVGHVRMHLARKLAERRLDLAVARPALDAEDLVVVTLGRGHPSQCSGLGVRFRLDGRGGDERGDPRRGG